MGILLLFVRMMDNGLFLYLFVKVSFNYMFDYVFIRIGDYVDVKC